MIESDDQIPEHDGDDLIAAEYVLGVLPSAEREAVARRMQMEAELARRVDAWEMRFGALASAYREVQPPSSVKAAIDRRLSLNTAASQPGAVGGFWSSLAVWRGLAGAALVALAVAVAIPQLNMPPKGQPERLVASLQDQGSDVRYLAVYDAARGEIGLSHIAGERGQGRDFELWVIEGQNAPRSLGVIPDGANVRVAVAPALGRSMDAGMVFAISSEPVGGSPTGAPTGPVVAAGDLRTI